MPPTELPPATAVFRLILALSMDLRSRMDARLAEIGLTTQQAAVLTFVETAPTPPAQGDVARFLGTTHQNARQVLDSLVRKGLVAIDPDPTDRRVRRVRCTSSVAATFAERDAADHAAVRGWLDALTDDELRQVGALLARAGRALRSRP